MAQKTYRVMPYQQVLNRGVWYYEGDVFKSDAPDLDLKKVVEEKGAAKLTERGEEGTVPHFVAEPEKKSKTKTSETGEGE